MVRFGLMGRKAMEMGMRFSFKEQKIPVSEGIMNPEYSETVKSHEYGVKSYLFKGVIPSENIDLACDLFDSRIPLTDRFHICCHASDK